MVSNGVLNVAWLVFLVFEEDAFSPKFYKTRNEGLKTKY